MSTEPTNNMGHAISGPGGSGRPYNPATSSVYNDEAGRGGIPYKWLVVVAVVFGIFMIIGRLYQTIDHQNLSSNLSLDTA